MFSNTMGIARKYGAKAATAAGALVVSGMAAAQSTSMGEQIQAKVTASFTQGELIAGGVVLGLFTLWAIKLLWKAK